VELKNKVLHIITSTDGGGAENMLLKYLTNTDKSKFSHIVVSLKRKGPIAKKIEMLGIKVFDLKFSKFKFYKLLNLLRISKNFRPEIIQTWLYHSDFLGLFVKIFQPSAKLIWSVRSNDVCKYKNSTCLLRKFLSYFSTFPDVIIFNSKRSISHHTDLGYKPKKIEFIPNGFDTSRFTPLLNETNYLKSKFNLNQEMILGMVARFSPEKDYETFFEACKLILEKNKNIRFFVVGKNINVRNSEIQNILNKLLIKESVYLLDESNEIENIIRCFDVMCLTSIDEAFPNVIGEAMSSGVPCVATNVGDTKILLKKGGIVVEPKNPSALAKACLMLLSISDKERQTIGDFSRKRIIDYYSVEKVSEKFDNLYQELLIEN